jgi:hypothetical protein
VVSAYGSAGDTGARAALLQTLGPSGSTEALPTLRGALRDSNAEVKRAAILALSEWPEGTPASELLETARSASEQAHQVLAVRGAIRLVGLPTPARAPRESVKLLADAMGLAKQPEEKRAVLAMLVRYPVPEALELARAATGDNQVAAEAKNAVTRLERMLKR